MDSHTELRPQASTGTRIAERWIAWRDRYQAVAVLVAIVLTLASLGAPGLPAWIFLSLLVAFVLLWAVLGAVEPALVVVVSVLCGALWGSRVQVLLEEAPMEPGILAGVLEALLLGTCLAYRRLAHFRRRQARFATVLAIFVLTLAAGATLLALSGGPRANLAGVLPILSAAWLTPIGMNILLPRGRASGTPRLRHLLGGAWVFLFLFAAQVLLLLVAAPLLRLTGAREERLTRLRRLARLGSRRLFEWFPYGRREILGATPETFAEPAVVVSNHQSSVDIPLVLGLPADIRLTLKKRVWDAPYLGIAARALGHVLVDKDRPETTLERCRAAMTEGACVHFFPEGTRAEDIYPKRFHRGAFDIAVELKRNVIPVVLCDSRLCVPRDAWWVDDHHMVVKVLPPVTPETFDYSAGSRELMRHVQGLVRAELTSELGRINTTAYLTTKVRRHYRYLGRSVERLVARELREPAVRTLSEVPIPEEGLWLDLFSGVGVRANWLRETHPRLHVAGFEADGDAMRIASASAFTTARLSFTGGSPDSWVLPAASGAILGAVDPALFESLLPRLIHALPREAPLILLDPRKGLRESCVQAGFRLYPNEEGMGARVETR